MIAVKAFGRGVLVADDCTFACWLIGAELMHESKAAMTRCYFHYHSTALLMRVSVGAW